MVPVRRCGPLDESAVASGCVKSIPDAVITRSTRPPAAPPPPPPPPPLPPPPLPPPLPAAALRGHKGNVLDGVVERLEGVDRRDLVAREVVDLEELVGEHVALRRRAGQPADLDDADRHAEAERVEHELDGDARADLAARAGERDAVLQAGHEELLVRRVECDVERLEAEARLAHRPEAAPLRRRRAARPARADSARSDASILPPPPPPPPPLPPLPPPPPLEARLRGEGHLGVEDVELVGLGEGEDAARRGGEDRAHEGARAEQRARLARVGAVGLGLEVEGARPHRVSEGRRGPSTSSAAWTARRGRPPGFGVGRQRARKGSGRATRTRGRASGRTRPPEAHQQRPPLLLTAHRERLRRERVAKALRRARRPRTLRARVRRRWRRRWRHRTPRPRRAARACGPPRAAAARRGRGAAAAAAAAAAAPPPQRHPGAA